MIGTEYPLVRDGLSIHFFGNIAIVTDEMGMQYQFGKKQTEVLSFCNGLNDVNRIIEKLLKRYVHTESDIATTNAALIKFIDDMICKNILVLSTKPNKCKNIYGELYKYYPLSLSIELTDKCNFLCEHCYKSAIHNGEDISSNIIYKIYHTFKNKTEQIQFTGGEPFIHPEIKNYIDLFAQCFKIRVATNGSLLYKYDINTIRKLDFVQFSLYGASAEEYKRFTGNENGWNALKRSIQTVLEAGTDYILSVVLNKENIYKLEDFICAAIHLNATRIKFGIPSLVGRALSDFKEGKRFLLTAEETKYAYREMRRLKEKYKDHISVAVWSHRSGETIKPFFADSIYEGLLPCGAGYSSYVISQKGEVRPCELLPESIFSFGNEECFDGMVQGEFYKNLLGNQINTFHNVLCKCNAKLEHICTPLRLAHQSYLEEQSLFNSTEQGVPYAKK